MERDDPPGAPLAGRHPLFAALSPRAATALAGRIQPFEVRGGTLLVHAGDRLERVWLVSEGLVATLVRTADGKTAESGLIGPGGLVGHWGLIGATAACADAAALTVARGLAVDLAALARAASFDPALESALRGYALARVLETERLCACAALHPVEARIAGWLARAATLDPERPVGVTHQQLAEVLGVRRASVTTSLHVMEGERAVRCRRGSIEVRDLARLEAQACGCFRPLASRRSG